MHTQILLIREGRIKEDGMKFWGGYVVGKSVGSCRKEMGVDMIKTNRICIKIFKKQVKLLFKSNIVLAKPKDVANTVFIFKSVVKRKTVDKIYVQRPLTFV